MIATDGLEKEYTRQNALFGCIYQNAIRLNFHTHPIEDVPQVKTELKTPDMIICFKPNLRFSRKRNILF